MLKDDDDDYFAQRAAGFRHLAKTYRSAGQVREAASCEAAARRDDAAAGRKYAVALRETEHPGVVFLHHLPGPIRILSPEESLLRVAQRAAERGDWPGEERALRELRALRLRK